MTRLIVNRSSYTRGTYALQRVLNDAIEVGDMHLAAAIRNRLLAESLSVGDSVIADESGGGEPGEGLVHGQSIVIEGSGFGSKLTSAPLVWDNGRVNAGLSGRYYQAYPASNTDSASNMAYRVAPFTRSGGTGAQAIDTPDGRGQYILAGGATGGSSGNLNYNTRLVTTLTIPGTPFVTLARWWERVDPAWNSGFGSPSDNNFKFFGWSGGSPMETNTPGGNWYLNYSPTVDFSEPGYQLNDDMTGSSSQALYFPDEDGRSAWGGGWSSAHDPRNWLLREMFIEHRTDAQGRIHCWQHRIGASPELLQQYRGRTRDGYSGSNRFMYVGGYQRSYFGPNQWRYFYTTFMDIGEGWFYLTNNADWSSSTIRELQPWSDWSDSSVEIEVYLGRLQGSSAHLHFRMAPWRTSGHQYLGAREIE